MNGSAKMQDQIALRSLQRVREIDARVTRVLVVVLAPLLALLPQFYLLAIDTNSLFVQSARLKKLDAANTQKQTASQNSVEQQKLTKATRKRYTSVQRQIARTKKIEVPIGYKDRAIGISRLWAPALWSIAAIATLIFVAYSRKQILVGMTGAVNSLHSDMRVSLRDLRQLIDNVPLWVVPFPSDSGALSKARFRDGLGWLVWEPIWKYSVVLMLLLLAISQLLVMCVSLAVRDELADTSFERALGLVPCVALAAVFYYCWWWFHGQANPWRFPSTQIRSQLFRREFVTGFGAIAAVLFLFPLAERFDKFTSHWSRRPRFRRKRHHMGRPVNGFHLQGSLVHFVSKGRKRLVCERGIPQNSHPITDDALATKVNALHMACGHSGVEKAALHFVAHKDYRRACDVLIAGLKEEQHGYGLHRRTADLRQLDLLAGLAAKSGNQYAMKKALEIAAHVQRQISIELTRKQNLQSGIMLLNGSRQSNIHPYIGQGRAVAHALRMPETHGQASPALAQPAVLETPEARNMGGVVRFTYPRGSKKDGRGSKIRRPLREELISSQLLGRLKRWQDPKGAWWRYWAHNPSPTWGGIPV